MAELTSQIHSHLGIGMWKKTDQTKGMVGLGKTEFGQNAAICLGEEAIFVKFQLCWYHVTFDLEWEHTLDADQNAGPVVHEFCSIQTFACENMQFL